MRINEKIGKNQSNINVDLSKDLLFFSHFVLEFSQWNNYWILEITNDNRL